MSAWILLQARIKNLATLATIWINMAATTLCQNRTNAQNALEAIGATLDIKRVIPGIEICANRASKEKLRKAIQTVCNGWAEKLQAILDLLRQQ